MLDLLWVSWDAVLVNFHTDHMESKGTQTGMELLTCSGIYNDEQRDL